MSGWDFFLLSFSGDISFMFLMSWNAIVGFFLCVCVFKQLLQVAVVDSVPTFGEDFFLKLRR